LFAWDANPPLSPEQIPGFDGQSEKAADNRRFYEGQHGGDR